MGLFATKTTLESIDAQLATQSAQLIALKARQKHIELEWEELYDKVRHQLSRMRRRDAIAAKQNGDQPPLDAPVEPDDGIDPISRSILARRGIRRQAE